MTQEEKARAYDEVVNKLRRFMKQGVNPLITRANVQDFFPELAESEDEKIRKALLEYFGEECDTATINGIYCYKIYDWLEKQGDKPKKVSIWKHWKDGIAGGAEGEQIFLTKVGRVYSISSCLGCECDYIELSELDKLMREEKTKWSEEDERHENTIMRAIHGAGNITPIDGELAENWLKTIKQRWRNEQ